MVNCSYCDKQIKRLIFCCPSHKVMYHRKGKTVHTIQAPIKTVQDAIQAVQALPTHRGLCKHGHMIGLCNHGCK